MKIVRRGIVCNDTQRFMCYRCGTVFDADEGEYNLSNYSTEKVLNIELRCKCPLCEKNVYKYIS